MGASKNELAEDRTDLAEDRTILASERTYAAWMRTGLAALAVGVGFEKIFDQVEPTWAAKAIATLFVLAGLLVFGVAHRRFLNLQSRLEAHSATKRSTWSHHVLISLAMSGTLLAGVAIWLL